MGLLGMTWMVMGTWIRDLLRSAGGVVGMGNGRNEVTSESESSWLCVEVLDIKILDLRTTERNKYSSLFNLVYML